MKHTLLISKRIYKQLLGDKRFLGLSIIAPFIIIYFLKILFDGFGPFFPSTRYIVPAAGFIIYFLSFILCAILIVQERNNGTLERMFVSGFKKIEIIGGYTFGYLGLATLQSIIVVTEVYLLFDLNYSFGIVISLFLVLWLLAIVSVMLGIFISTFARSEAQVFPFIPLIILPSVFFSGLLIDTERLPDWAIWFGHILPIYYSNQIVLDLVKPEGSLSNNFFSLTVLFLYGVVLLILASKTLKDRD
jgi:ABC-2 type transport system permease protein